MGACKRFNRDTEAYNAVGVRVAREHGASINDLYALMNAAPASYHSDLTHYYTKEGTRLLTEQVKAHIEDAMGVKGRELDYDALFAKTTDAIGV